MYKFSKSISLILILILFQFGFSQEEKIITKMDRFVSNTGSIIKLENYYMPELKGYSTVAKVQVRKATSADDVGFFLQIIKEDKYGNKSASIAEEDLIEVIKAYDELVIQSNREDTNADYFENKFTTEDGFQIGYGGGKNRLWFLILEKFGESTILFQSHELIGTALKNGLKKIEGLKL
jgi:S-adenosylmethionine hydrolase|tara:strand:- start:94 stop:630 length:537 start_codon:yes stop_codon:yes gene_type:complete